MLASLLMINRRTFIRITAPTVLAGFIFFQNDLYLTIKEKSFFERDLASGFRLLDKKSKDLHFFYKGWTNRYVSDSLYEVYLANQNIFHGVDRSLQGSAFYFSDINLKEIV